jgi:6-phospho-beta-glucosidase
MRVASIGGGSLRTPLLIHGIAEAQSTLGVTDLAIYDVDPRRAALMAKLGELIVRDRGIRITAPATVEDAVEGASFVLSSIRVGGMAARAQDERIAIEHGFAGQETTGPGGLAMGLRTIPVALNHARLIEGYAPNAWLINFTNPAGMITQALINHSNVRVIGICDTPSELFHRIAWSLGHPFEQLEFQYVGLNHLGWVKAILHNGEDLMPRLLDDNEALARLYPADLFDPALIRAIRLIPTEYLYFYYSQRRALRNQQTAGASRGGEILRLNTALLIGLDTDLAEGKPFQALDRYKHYLNQRNASYMRLEGNAESAFAQGQHDWNPFEGETGYHRIAIDVMSALLSEEPRTVVVNVRNGDALQDLAPDDVIEGPSVLSRSGVQPLPVGKAPEPVQALLMAVKRYERLAIRAAVEKSFDLARLALLANPIVNDWDAAGELLTALVATDGQYLGYLSGTTISSQQAGRQ